MKKRIILFAILFLTVMNLAALATWGYKRLCIYCGGKRCPQTTITADDILQKKLHLSEEQLARMKQIRCEYHRKTANISRELAERRLLLSKMIMDDIDDFNKIDRICNQMDSLQAAMQRIVVQHLLAQKKILEPEQRQIFSTLMMNCCATNQDTSNQCIHLKN